MKRFISLVVTLCLVCLSLGFLERLLPGHFDQAELFQGQTFEKADFFAIQLRYLKVLLGQEWGPSALFAHHSARLSMLPYLYNSLKMMILTLVLCLLIFVTLVLFQTMCSNRRYRLNYISDIILSIPLIFMLPLFFWMFRDYLMEWPDLYKMLLVSLIVAIKPAVLLWQSTDHYLQEIKKELFVKTWFAMGGGPYLLVWRWLRRFWLFNMLQWLPYLLSQFIMGSFLATNLLQIPSFGYLYVESLTVRDWSIFGPLTLMIAVLMLGTQYMVDIFSREIKA